LNFTSIIFRRRKEGVIAIGQWKKEESQHSRMTLNWSSVPSVAWPSLGVPLPVTAIVGPDLARPTQDFFAATPPGPSDYKQSIREKRLPDLTPQL
jgi:hypothetical protein